MGMYQSIRIWIKILDSGIIIDSVSSGIIQKFRIEKFRKIIHISLNPKYSH